MPGPSSPSAAVSVVVPTYNSRATLELALQSVLLQDFPDFEVWVVGDGCTDGSEAVVASLGDERFHWLGLAANSGGPAAPRRAGLRHARGRLVAYLGHDDLWFPWHLSGVVGEVDRSGADFACSIGAILAPEGLVGTFALPGRGARTAEISPSNWIHGRSLAEPAEAWWPDVESGTDVRFANRLADSDARCALWRELSVLKYPASLWRPYARRSDPPQREQLGAMRDDARRLRDELLVDLAHAVADRGRFLGRREGLLPKAVRERLWWAVTAYGAERWPARDLLAWRHRRRSGLE